MNFIGIDLHTNRFTCCYLSEDPSFKRMETFTLDQTGLDRFYATLDKESSVILEATINTFAFVSLFENKVKKVLIANTYQLKEAGPKQKKTDKVDAFKLAQKLKAEIMSGVQQIHAVFLPSKEYRDLRALFASYRVLRKEITMTKNRIHSLLKENLFPFTKEFIFGKKTRLQIRSISPDEILSFQINLFMDTLEALEAKAEELENKIMIFGQRFMPMVEILTSMSGISVITALALIADVVDVSRFQNAKHFTSYLRSAPRVESSNEHTLIKSTNKAGRRLSVTLLSQSLNHFRDSNKKLAVWYTRLSVYKKKGVIRMALCRRVFAEIYQMMKKGENHYFRNPVLHEKKIAQYKAFLAKEKK
ncbi:MAG: IS110 family transposase [Spirochaetaceae bacterium]|jgi:transposase|nr:IS110 family transposase [Spirochaetaceae bacterium]